MLGEQPFQYLLDLHVKLGGPSYFLPAIGASKRFFAPRAWKPEPMTYAKKVELSKTKTGKKRKKSPRA